MSLYDELSKYTETHYFKQCYRYGFVKFDYFQESGYDFFYTVSRCMFPLFSRYDPRLCDWLHDILQKRHPDIKLDVSICKTNSDYIVIKIKGSYYHVFDFVGYYETLESVSNLCLFINSLNSEVKKD